MSHKEIGRLDAALAELRAGLHIDKEALDEALQEQPVQFDRAGALVAERTARRDRLKNELGLYDANLSAKLRGLKDKKWTEKGLAEAVERDSGHQELVDKHITASYYVAAFAAVQESYRQRGYMLRELANLWTAGYWQETSVTGTQADVERVDYRRMRKVLARTRLEG